MSVVVVANGQETDTLSTDTVEVIEPVIVQKTHWGLYLDYGLIQSPNPGGANNLEAIGGVIEYQRWAIGFYRAELVGDVFSVIIFPNVFGLEYTYGQVDVSFSPYQSKWVHGWLTASYGQGEMIWKNSASDEAFLGDTFNLQKLSAQVEFSYLGYVKPYIGFGYQNIGGLSIPSVEQNEFEGVFLMVGVKLGFVNK
jgi:hypothetical protein